VAKIFRVTSVSPQPDPQWFGLLGDYVYLGLGQSGEEVYGDYYAGSPPGVHFCVSKVATTNRWTIAPGYYYVSYGWPPGVSPTDPVRYGWDGGIHSGAEPPTGNYAYFQLGSYSIARPDLHGELIGESAAHLPWWPWCCLPCGSSASSPLPFCGTCLGPVPDYYVLLSFTGNLYDLGGDYRVYAGDSDWSPRYVHSCSRFSPVFKRTLLALPTPTKSRSTRPSQLRA
jgi:hypothetical protein